MLNTKKMEKTVWVSVCERKGKCHRANPFVYKGLPSVMMLPQSARLKSRNSSHSPPRNSRAKIRKRKINQSGLVFAKGRGSVIVTRRNSSRNMSTP